MQFLFQIIMNKYIIHEITRSNRKYIFQVIFHKICCFCPQNLCYGPNQFFYMPCLTTATASDLNQIDDGLMCGTEGRHFSVTFKSFFAASFKSEMLHYVESILDKPNNVITLGIGKSKTSLQSKNRAAVIPEPGRFDIIVSAAIISSLSMVERNQLILQYKLKLLMKSILLFKLKILCCRAYTVVLQLYCLALLLMMTAESMLRKRSVLGIIVILFFLWQFFYIYCIPS